MYSNLDIAGGEHSLPHPRLQNSCKMCCNLDIEEGLNPLPHQSLQRKSSTSRDAARLRKQTFKNVQLLVFLWVCLGFVGFFFNQKSQKNSATCGLHPFIKFI